MGVIGTTTGIIVSAAALLGGNPTMEAWAGTGSRAMLSLTVAESRPVIGQTDSYSQATNLQHHLQAGPGASEPGQQQADGLMKRLEGAPEHHGLLRSLRLFPPFFRIYEAAA